jgi:hypothetical protein
MGVPLVVELEESWVRVQVLLAEVLAEGAVVSLAGLVVSRAAPDSCLHLVLLMVLTEVVASRVVLLEVVQEVVHLVVMVAVPSSGRPPRWETSHRPCLAECQDQHLVRREHRRSMSSLPTQGSPPTVCRTGFVQGPFDRT